MTFEAALERLKIGERAKRRGWEEGRYLSLTQSDFRAANGSKLFSKPFPRPEIHPPGPVIVEATPDPKNWKYQFLRPWDALDDDLTANDWLAKDGAMNSRWNDGSEPGWFQRLLGRYFA